jgi:Chorismate mutase
MKRRAQQNLRGSSKIYDNDNVEENVARNDSMTPDTDTDTDTNTDTDTDTDTTVSTESQIDASIVTTESDSLESLREEIKLIDRELVELIARRTYVADSIAQVKSEQGLPTTDEGQEARVMERAGANAEHFDVDANLVKAVFRLLIELNKVEQRQNR